MPNTLVTSLSAGLLVLALKWPCTAQEVFPGNIFELRPPHVRVSELSESESHPRSYRSFPFFEAPPTIPQQDTVRLTNEDQLTLVYAAHGGSSFSGGLPPADQVKKSERTFEMDIFRFFPIPYGDAFVPAFENGRFLGRLEAGEYEVIVRNWYLPPAVHDFDPETFERPANAVMPTGDIFAIPTSLDEPLVFTESNFYFQVIAIPEPISFVLFSSAILAVLASARCRRPHRLTRA